MHHRRPTYFLLLAALLAGCPAPGGVTGPTKPGASARPAPASSPAPAAARGLLEGRVAAPAGIVAAGAGNLIGADGATIVAAGAGNLIGADGASIVAAGAGNWRILALAEQPVADAEVVLTDGLGKVVPGVRVVKTSKDGRYRFENVPAGQAVAVHVGVKTASGRTTTLVTLARPGADARPADVGAASTCVAVALLGPQGKAIRGFDPQGFGDAVAAVGREVTAEGLPDLADRQAVTGWMSRLEAKVDGLSRILVTLDAKIDDRFDAIEAKLDELLAQRAAASPAPTATVPPGGTSPAPSPSASWNVPPPPGPPNVNFPSPAAASPATAGALTAVGAIAGLTADPIADAWGASHHMAVAPEAGVAWFDSMGGVTKLPLAGGTAQVVRVANSGLQPRDLALAEGGDLWIADAYSGAAVRVTPDGKVARTEPAGLGTPTGVAVTPDGTVWLSGSQRIARYGLDGTKKNVVEPDTANIGTLAVDAEGHVWATLPTANAVIRLDAAGKEDRRVAVRYPAGELVAGGTGVWVHSPDGVTYVPATGDPVTTAATGHWFAADAAGNAWVPEGAEVKAYGPDGKSLGKYAFKGTFHALAAGAAGDVWLLAGDALTRLTTASLTP